MHRVSSYAVCDCSVAACAVQLCHNKILDTVALYPHPKGPPARSKLRVLATRVSANSGCSCQVLLMMNCDMFVHLHA